MRRSKVVSVSGEKSTSSPPPTSGRAPAAGCSVHESAEQPLFTSTVAKRSTFRVYICVWALSPTSAAQAATSAAHCIVRVVAGWSRPSAVQTSDLFTIPCTRKSPAIPNRVSIKGRLRRVSARCCSNGRRYTHPGPRRILGLVKISAGLDVAAVSRRGSVKLRTTKECMDTCVAPARCLRGAACFSSPAQLWLPKRFSLLNIQQKVVRPQDTPCTCVQVEQTSLRDIRVTRVLSSHHLLPRTFGLQNVRQMCGFGSA